jgi:surface protein
MEGNKQENENTVKLYEYYNYNEEIAIVMEYCDENLTNMIINKKRIFNFSEIKEILNQLNNSFKIMYENKLAHRDLKPENILVKYKNENDKNDFIIKLSDYGEAKKLTMTRSAFSTKIGTPNYMAPEILLEETYDLKCDLWSLGVLIYILYFRELPYPMAKTDIALINHINKYGQKYFKKSKNEDFDDLINKLLIKDPNERISWEEYFKHPFLAQNQILISIKINEEDINKEILFINGKNDNGNKNEEIENLDINDLELYINNNLSEFKNYFIPEKEGEYIIKINFRKKLKDLSYMFNNCKNIIKIDLSLFDSYEVINISNMFGNCYSLEEINLSGINVNKVIDMSYLFNKCYVLKKIIFDDSFNTKNVENTSFMFNECKNLKEIDLCQFFITNKIKNMEGMFKNCNNLEKLDFEKFVINEFTNIDYMFDGCYKLKNIPEKFKNITRIIIDENLKVYNYNEKLKFDEQAYFNKFHLEFEIKKVFCKVKEYDEKGKLIFEGEYLNGDGSENKKYDDDNIILNIKNGNNQTKKLSNDRKLLFIGVYLYRDKLIRKGKEYDYDDKVEFEGEYLNGKRWNGKGKEYNDDGKLKFEGEFLNGKAWNGKGKEYDYNGKLEYEGDYLNGKRHGKGKEYNDDGKLEYEGDYLNGKRHGKGKEYYYNGRIRFEGEYLNGKRHGKGKEYNFDDKLEYEGDYLNGERHGKGKEYYKNGKLEYEGEYLNGERHGKGKEYYKNGELAFKGEYLNGKRWNGIFKEYNHNNVECKTMGCQCSCHYYN